MTAQPLVVHITDVLSYRSCRRRWNWSSRFRSNLEPVRPYAPFFTGTAVHRIIRELTSNGTPPHLTLSKFLREQVTAMKMHRSGRLWAEERSSIKEQVHEIRSMVNHYKLWRQSLSGPLADENLNYLSHEYSFGRETDNLVPLRSTGSHLTPTVYLAGKFDGLVERRLDHTIWLKEYKTCRSVEERAKLLPHDDQATAYVYAAQMLWSEPVSGVIYTLIRKKVPTQPKVLKSGMLSVDKGIDTTPEAYLEAIRTHHGEDATPAFVQANYGNVLGYLRDFSKPFVARVAIERSQLQIDLFVRELHATALEMFDERTVMYANRQFSCPGCWFREPCLAMDRGDSDRRDMLLEHQYQQRAAETDESEIILS